MNRAERRRAGAAAPGAIGAALLKGLNADLSSLRFELCLLSADIAEGRADGYDMTAGEAKLGELTAKIASMSAEIARMRAV